MNYFFGYPQEIQDKIQEMQENDQIAPYLLNKYPQCHAVKNDSQLSEFTQSLKKQKMKQSASLKKVSFDRKLAQTHGAFGLNTHTVKSHGKKLKSIKEIRIASVFQHVPEEFLTMIVAHELAHIREMNHSKQFYQLCNHIVSDYAQLELDFRLYLVLKESGTDIYL